ncbi:MAG TPA: iron chelate uptake ABC transporter family permease subunit [Nocardioidaceae bacterium]|nr:iron chelate uptake ABC transporter family permease subunit [Nocardioidaceae bacterium]
MAVIDSLRPARNRVSGRRRPGRRNVAVCGVLAVLLLVTVTVSLSVGDYPVPFTEVLHALVLPSWADLIVQELRLPRVLTGVAAGAAFGLAGAIFQAMVRNPLASPDLIGVTAGAGVGAVAAITLVGVSAAWVPVLALAGGGLTAALVYVLAWRRGLHVSRLVVIGVALGGTGFAAGALNSLTSLLVANAEITDAQEATVWLTGSLHGRDMEMAAGPLIALGVALPFLPAAARTLRSLSLGDDVAAGLGTRLGPSRLGLFVLGICLAATATAAVGAVNFVALGAPQIARRLTRSHVEPLVASALVGALVVTAADIVARRLFAPVELPVGVFTAAIGAPYLLWLLTRSGGVR